MCDILDAEHLPWCDLLKNGFCRQLEWLKRSVYTGSVNRCRVRKILKYVRIRRCLSPLNMSPLSHLMNICQLSTAQQPFITLLFSAISIRAIVQSEENATLWISTKMLFQTIYLLFHKVIHIVYGLHCLLQWGSKQTGHSSYSSLSSFMCTQASQFARQNDSISNNVAAEDSSTDIPLEDTTCRPSWPLWTWLLPLFCPGLWLWSSCPHDSCSICWFQLNYSVFFLVKTITCFHWCSLFCAITYYRFF